MSAQPSLDPLRDSLAIAAGSLRHSILCPCDADMFARCTCGIEAARKILVERIDSHVLAGVERERERCARIADTFASVAKAEARFDAAEDARFIAEQIRARVKELEAKQSSSVHIDMAGIYVDGVKYTPEQVRSVVRRLAAIRDAAGAQP